jgi:hypothetical protein
MNSTSTDGMDRKRQQPDGTVFQQIYDFEKRNYHFYMIGDLVIIASQESIQWHDPPSLLHARKFSVIGLYGNILEISGHSIETMKEVKADSHFMLKLKIRSGPDANNIKEVSVLHTDVVNITVLGDTVGQKLFEVTKDKKYDSMENILNDCLIPESYNEYTLKLVTTWHDREKIQNLQLKFHQEARMQLNILKDYFLEWNRKLRWKVTNNMLKNLPSIEGFDEFEKYPARKQTNRK